MAQNPVLGKLQGQGLVETTTAGLEQAGAQLATTPVGAAMQGRGADSLKMAGTQPAKINALRAGMRESQSQALAGLREKAAGAATAEEQARLSTLRSATVAGKVDERIRLRAENQAKAALSSLTFGGAEIDTSKLPVGYNTTSLQKSIFDLISNGPDLNDADVAQINDALLKIDPKSPTISYEKDKQMDAVVLANSLSALYKNKTKTEIQGAIQKALTDAKAGATIGSLDDTDAVNILGKEGAKAEELISILTQITGKDAAAVQGMQLWELRDAIQNWKQTEFQDVTKLREQANSPLTSRAQRQLALEQLRRLGQLEITAYEQKVGDLEKQMQDGDKLTIGTEEFTIEEVFKDPAKLLQLQTWNDNPETAPPELKTFLQANQNAIADQIQKLIGGADAGLTGAIGKIQTNANAVKLDESLKTLPEETIEAFFPGMTKVGLDSKLPQFTTQDQINALPETTAEQKAAKTKAQSDLNNYLKYNLLQQPATAQNTALLMSRLLTIPGVDGKKIFEDLTLDQMRELARADFRVNDFVAALGDRNTVSQFKGDSKNPQAEFALTMDALKLGQPGKQLSNLIGKNLSEYKDIFKQAGLSDLLNPDGTFRFEALTSKLNELKNASLSDLLAGKATQIKDSLTSLTSKLTEELGRVSQRMATPVAEADREALFQKETNNSRPEQALEVERNYRNSLMKQAYDIRQQAESKLREIVDIDNQLRRRNYTQDEGNALRARRAKLGTEYTTLKSNQDTAEIWLRRAEAVVLDYENNMSKKLVEYADKQAKWWNQYQAKLAADNKVLQDNYDKLGQLLRGVA